MRKVKGRRDNRVDYFLALAFFPPAGSFLFLGPVPLLSSYNTNIDSCLSEMRNDETVYEVSWKSGDINSDYHHNKDLIHLASMYSDFAAVRAVLGLKCTFAVFPKQISE